MATLFHLSTLYPSDVMHTSRSFRPSPSKFAIKDRGMAKAWEWGYPCTAWVYATSDADSASHVCDTGQYMLETVKCIALKLKTKCHVNSQLLTVHSP